jgi:hypothetical protein
MCGKCFSQEFLFVAKVVIIDWKAGILFLFWVPILWFRGQLFFFLLKIFSTPH